MKVSGFLSGRNNGYFDVDVDTDTVAFINPWLVYKKKNNYFNMVSASKKIDSFFIYATGMLNKSQLSAISKVKEENATHLGYSKLKSVGHGPNSDDLTLMLKNLSKNVQYPALQGINNNAAKLSALTMFVPNFSYDSLSDLVTRIIAKELYDFTIDTVTSLGFSKYIQNKKFKLQYWDSSQNKWVKKDVPKGFFLNGEFTLLIPENVVETGKFDKNPDKYIRHVIAPRIIYKNPHTANHQTKQSIIDDAIKDANGKKSLVKQDIIDNPQDFIDYFDS